MIKILLTLSILFFNPVHAHDLETEFFELKNQTQYKLFASNQKKKKSKKEKEKKINIKKTQKWISYKYPRLKSDCLKCKNLEGFVEPNTIDLEIFRMAGIIPGRPTHEDIKIQKKRGMIVMGMTPKFYNDGKCKTCDDCWAINYSKKREGFPALHKGRDLPMPFNTPVLAMADGLVVGIFKNERSRKGIEVVLRHTPDQTNLPFFTYSQYTHFNKWPLDIQIGQKVKVGDVLGPNGNSGKKGKNIRRPGLHFSVFKSDSPHWSSFERGFLVKDGYWMDPVTFFKKTGPYGHKKLKKLKKKEKEILISYKTNQGKIIPNNAKKIWPFSCDPGNIAKKHINFQDTYIENIAKTIFKNSEKIKQ